MGHTRLAALAAAAGVTMAIVFAAPAQAWPGDPTVTTYGDDGCGGGQLATVYALSPNGEWLFTSAEPSGGYALTFTQVPAGGESVRFDVFCAVTGQHTIYQWVTPPEVGTTQLVNL